MAYDETLAERIRDYLADISDVTERKMFGGIAFMLSGNMAVGVSGDEMMVRIPPEEHDELIAEPGVRDFDLSGRAMKGWILVSGERLAEESDLAHWIGIGTGFAGSLPPK